MPLPRAGSGPDLAGSGPLNASKAVGIKSVIPYASGTRHPTRPLRITSMIGQGGMGEVYRATDPVSGREVAVKVLPGHLGRPALHEAISSTKPRPSPR